MSLTNQYYDDDFDSDPKIGSYRVSDHVIEQVQEELDAEEHDFLFSFQLPVEIIDELRNCDASLRLLVKLEENEVVTMSRSMYESLPDEFKNIDGMYWDTYFSENNVALIPHESE